MQFRRRRAGRSQERAVVPCRTWLTAMASLLLIISHTLSTLAWSVRSKPKMSGLETMHQAPKWARSSAKEARLPTSSMSGRRAGNNVSGTGKETALAGVQRVGLTWVSPAARAREGGVVVLELDGGLEVIHHALPAGADVTGRAEEIPRAPVQRRQGITPVAVWPAHKRQGRHVRRAPTQATVQDGPYSQSAPGGRWR